MLVNALRGKEDEYEDEEELEAEEIIEAEEIERQQRRIKEEKIEPEEEAINTKVTEMADTYGKSADELKQNEQFMNYIKNFIVNEKVVKFIVENAKIK